MMPPAGSFLIMCTQQSIKVSMLLVDIQFQKSELMFEMSELSKLAKVKFLHNKEMS